MALGVDRRAARPPEHLPRDGVPSPARVFEDARPWTLARWPLWKMEDPEPSPARQLSWLRGRADIRRVRKHRGFEPHSGHGFYANTFICARAAPYVGPRIAISDHCAFAGPSKATDGDPEPSLANASS